MERLKARSSQQQSEGELVTRADGTQAIRVRKRKRRTNQPKRDAEKRLRRIRTIQLSIALVALILLTLVIGGAYLYTNTAPFRNKLTGAIEAELGASAKLREFRVTPLSANAVALTLNWPEGRVPEELELRHISAKMAPSTILGRAFTGSEISALEGRLLLRPEAQGQAAAPHEDAGAMPIHFDRMVVNKLDMAMLNQENPVFRIVGSEATLSFPQERGWKTLDFYRGNFAFGKQPPLGLDRARMEIHPGEIRMLGMRIYDSIEPKGTLDFSGSINLLSPENRSVLAIKAASFNLPDLFGPEIARFIQIRLDTREVADSNFLAFPANSPADVEISVAFSNSDRDPHGGRAIVEHDDKGRMSTKPVNNYIVGFPFLSSLAKATDDSFYRNPAFEEITGIITAKNGETTITDLECIRKNRINLRGNITIGKNKELSGTLELGLPEPVFKFIEDQRFKAVFGPVVKDCHWATVRLSGTSAAPADDFTENYQLANPAAAPDGDASQEEDPDSPSADDPGRAFEDLTTPSR